MTISGSSDFTVTRNEILRLAALDVNAIGLNDTLSTTLLQDFSKRLNGICKAWQEGGIHIWTVSEATLFPAVGQVKYGLGGATMTAHVTETYYQTAITATEANGQTTLSVDDTSNITAADHIGIMLDDGTLHWTTVISKTATTVLVTLALVDSAATGNPVFTYTNRIVRPLKIIDARRYNISEATTTPLRIASRQEYNSLPRKTEVGEINEVHYDPQNTTGLFYHWQSVNPIEDLIQFTWYRPIDDFDAAADTPDLPQGWMNALEFALAEVLASGSFPVTDSVFQRIQTQAARYLDIVSTFDREAESIEISPDFGYG